MSQTGIPQLYGEMLTDQTQHTGTQYCVTRSGTKRRCKEANHRNPLLCKMKTVTIHKWMHKDIRELLSAASSVFQQCLAVREPCLQMKLLLSAQLIFVKKSSTRFIVQVLTSDASSAGYSNKHYNSHAAPRLF
ncbi:hypothetical protein MHYP_G00166110 [Metynnis hypsauchen]